MSLLPQHYDRPAGKFDFQGQKLMLTYPTHMDKDQLLRFLEANVPQGLKFARAAHETGDDGYAHTHVLLDFGKPFKARSAARFDIVAGDVSATGNVGKAADCRPVTKDDILHPNWRPVKTITHWRNCTKYIAKQDPANADLLTDTTGACVSSVWNAPTLQDALMANVKKFSDVGGIMQLYAAKPSAIDRALRDPNPWQKWMLDLVEQDPHPRHVHWIYDPVGNTGKTVLADYLVSLRKAYVVENVGNSRDFATIIANAMASGWDGRCCILDLPRSLEGRESIYSAVESVKNGRVTATKYSGGTTYLPTKPHVFVFANFSPDISRLSADRWKLYKVNSQALTLKGLDLSLRENGHTYPSEGPVPPREDNLMVVNTGQNLPEPGPVPVPTLSLQEILELSARYNPLPEDS